MASATNGPGRYSPDLDPYSGRVFRKEDVKEFKEHEELPDAEEFDFSKTFVPEDGLKALQTQYGNRYSFCFGRVWEGFAGFKETDKSKQLVYEKSDEQFFKSAMKVAELAKRPIFANIKGTKQKGNLFLP